MPATGKTPRSVPDVHMSVVILVVFGLFLVVTPLLGPKSGMTVAGTACYVLVAAIALYALLRRRDGREVVVDERERQIKRRSGEFAGMCLLCVAGVVPVVLMWACWVQGKQTITLEVVMLPAIGMGVISAYMVAMSIGLIVLHWRGLGHAE